MSPYAKLDDRYDDNRKVKRAWRRSRAAIGLHAMAITYSARHHTDGAIDIDWLEEKLPNPKERTSAVKALVDAGLFEPTADGDGFIVHDYLEHQASAAQIDEKRRERAAAGKKGAEARWGAQQSNGSEPEHVNGSTHSDSYDSSYGDARSNSLAAPRTT